MTLDGAADLFDRVERTVKDPEIAAWLETGPVLGGPEPIAAQRLEATEELASLLGAALPA